VNVRTWIWLRPPASFYAIDFGGVSISDTWLKLYPFIYRQLCHNKPKKENKTKKNQAWPGFTGLYIAHSSLS